MRQYSTALCSYGMSGRVFHGPLLEKHPGYKITKILERRKSASAGLHPHSSLVRNYRQILDDKEVELVVVNTPDHFHTEMCRQALEAGKHVVVEKPFTLNSSEGKELEALAAEKGLLLSVFHNRRWDSDFSTLRDVLQKGLIGRLVSFESRFDRFRPELKGSWKEDALDTGSLYNLGSHLIDQALVLFGMPEYLYCDSRGLRDGIRNDDSFELFLHYPDQQCLLSSSYLVRELPPRFTLHGDKGSFLVWGQDPQEAALAEGRQPDSEGWGLDESQSAFLHTGSGKEFHRGPWPVNPATYSSYYTALHSALEGEAENPVPGAEGRAVIEVIEAAYRSAREQRVVHF